MANASAFYARIDINLKENTVQFIHLIRQSASGLTLSPQGEGKFSASA